MILRFLSAALVALALMLTPLSMIGDGGAMAHKAAIAHKADMASAADAHCAGSEQQDEDQEGSKAMLDCMSICSAIAGSASASFRPQPLFASSPEVFPVPFHVGIHPESDPPPPRLS